MKRLTPKERKLVALKVKGATHAKAYKEAYSKTAQHNTAVSNTDKILKRPHVKQALEAGLQKHEITLDNALAPIGKGLKAKKSHYNHKGEVVEVTEDLPLQLQSSDRALKLLGVNQNDAQSYHQHLHLHAEKYDI